MDSKAKKTEPAHFQECPCLSEKFREYFKVGVSPDFILIRDDFPMENLSPSDFSRLCREMFRRNGQNK